jgi:Zinc finger, C2H2 type
MNNNIPLFSAFRYHLLNEHNVTYKKIYEYIDEQNLQRKLDDLGPDLICHHCGKVFKHRDSLKRHFRVGGTIEN